MRSCLLTLTIMFMNCCIAFSQQVIGTCGAYLQSSSGSLSCTSGEPVISTLSTTSGIITQGFQQTRLTVTAVENYSNQGRSIVVYPNPIDEVLFVSLKDDADNSKLILYDLKGSILFVLTADKELTEIDFSAYVPGIYFLKVFKGNRSVGTFKIVKTKN